MIRRASARTNQLAALILLVGMIGAGVWWWRRPRTEHAHALTSMRELRAAHTANTVRIDGETDELDWQRAGRTGALACHAGSVCPHAELRVMWGGGMVYLALYAADVDIVSPAIAADSPVWLGDHFHLVFGDRGQERILDLSPRGVVTDAAGGAGRARDFGWQSGAKVGTDVDGTIDRSDDEDEEWSLEVAIPLDRLGLQGRTGERLPVSIRHCDVSRGAAQRCSSWGDTTGAGTLVLE